MNKRHSQAVCCSE